MEVHKILMDLDKYIAEDNVLYTESNLNDLESTVRKFRTKMRKAHKDLVAGQKYKKEIESDEL